MGIDSKWHSKWWATGLLLPVIAAGTYDFIKDKPVTSTLFKVFNWCITIIKLFFNHEIKVWHIIAFFVLLFVILYLLSLRKTKYPEVILKPDWINYKRDILKQWLWTWDYEKNPFTHKYEIVNLTPICQKCDIRMLGDDYYNGYYRCPKCNYSLQSSHYYKWEAKEDITALIIDKIEKEDFKKSNT